MHPPLEPGKGHYFLLVFRHKEISKNRARFLSARADARLAPLPLERVIHSIAFPLEKRDVTVVDETVDHHRMHWVVATAVRQAN